MTFDDLIQQALNEAPDHFSTPVLAADLVEKVRANSPGVLTDWLEVHAQALVTERMGTLRRAQNARFKYDAKRTEFGKAAERYGDGDPDAFDPFRDCTFIIDKDRTACRLGDMIGKDHLFVASEYEASAENDRLQASIHRAIAAKCGDRKTSEVYTQEELRTIMKGFQT